MRKSLSSCENISEQLNQAPKMSEDHDSRAGHTNIALWEGSVDCDNAKSAHRQTTDDSKESCRNRASTQSTAIVLPDVPTCGETVE